MTKIKFILSDGWFIFLLIYALFSTLAAMIYLNDGSFLAAKISIVITIPLSFLLLGYQLYHLIFFYDLLQLSKNNEDIILEIEK